MEEKCDLSGSDRDVMVGAGRAGLSIFVTDDFLRFSRTPVSQPVLLRNVQTSGKIQADRKSNVA